MTVVEFHVNSRCELWPFKSFPNPRLIAYCFGKIMLNDCSPTRPCTDLYMALWLSKLLELFIPFNLIRVYKAGTATKTSCVTLTLEDFILLGKSATRQEQIDRDIFECFIQYPGIWAYRIYRDQKNFLGKYVDERTVRRFVRRLNDEGLIDTEEKEIYVIEKKGKNLGTCGIYYVFLNIEMGRMKSDWTFRTILKNYGENILFQLFLYPDLNRETLLAIRKRFPDSLFPQPAYYYSFDSNGI